MNKEICNHHQWNTLRQASANTTSGHGGEIHESVLICKKCELVMSAKEAIEISKMYNSSQALRNSTIATCIAAISLITAIISLFVSSID